jgi:hypothetical protein
VGRLCGGDAGPEGEDLTTDRGHIPVQHVDGGCRRHGRAGGNFVEDLELDRAPLS